MNELFEKIYAASNIETEESKQLELFERIYNESEMLNEMNPKLRAMLLGGALAAGLGMQSCSMPTDIPYDPPVIEQPGPSEETPTNETDPGTDNENKENEMTPEETLASYFDNDTTHVERLKSANPIPNFVGVNSISDVETLDNKIIYSFQIDHFELISDHSLGLDNGVCYTKQRFAYHISNKYPVVQSLVSTINTKD